MNTFEKHRTDAPDQRAPVTYTLDKLRGFWRRCRHICHGSWVEIKRIFSKCLWPKLSVSNSDEDTNGTNSPANREINCYLMGMSFFLREPISRTKLILSENSFFLDRIDSLRNVEQSNKSLLKHKQSIEILDRENYLRLQESCPGSRLVCSYHFGDFVFGLNALMCLEDPGQRRLLLSQEKASETYFNKIGNCFGDRAVLSSNQLLASESDVLHLRELLRSRNTTLVMFCDLPQSFGACTEVWFLGRKAYFPKGPATLALASKVPLLPVISFADNGRNFVKTFQLITPKKLENESLELAVNRMTQELVNILEHYLRNFPYQWKYLRALPNYFQQAT